MKRLLLQIQCVHDRIEGLQRKIQCEVDPQRICGMQAKIKRYQDDKFIMKQYAENDRVVENGRVIKTQSEVVPALSHNHQPIIWPLIRLQEKNIISTHINPQCSREVETCMGVS
ncbi:PREDICTED: RNA polymerase II C-terminal domain phosphatase-like 1-like [Fragaria vesca subsp. vesca]